jgi:hypothetical protein
MAKPQSTFYLWTIFRYPKDYPNNYVARLFIYDRPGNDIRLANDLDGIRKLIPPGLFKINRDKDDDPCIVETWV